MSVALQAPVELVSARAIRQRLEAPAYFKDHRLHLLDGGRLYHLLRPVVHLLEHAALRSTAPIEKMVPARGPPIIPRRSSPS